MQIQWLYTFEYLEYRNTYSAAIILRNLYY